MTSDPASSLLVGRGISDVTGEPAGVGMLGYGKADQVTAGIHTRLRTRAFVFADPDSGTRLVLSVSDLPLMFDSVHREVLRRLRAKFGDRRTAGVNRARGLLFRDELLDDGQRLLRVIAWGNFIVR